MSLLNPIVRESTTNEKERKILTKEMLRDETGRGWRD
jgi:hypothetical protein